MRLLFLILLFSSAACGEIELEGPHRESPAPLCETWERFNEETGRCETVPCIWDEDCAESERCDRIDGICRS